MDVVPDILNLCDQALLSISNDFLESLVSPTLGSNLKLAVTVIVIEAPAASSIIASNTSICVSLYPVISYVPSFEVDPETVIKYPSLSRMSEKSLVVIDITLVAASKAISSNVIKWSADSVS